MDELFVLNLSNGMSPVPIYPIFRTFANIWPHAQLNTTETFQVDLDDVQKAAMQSQTVEFIISDKLVLLFLFIYRKTDLR